MAPKILCQPARNKVVPRKKAPFALDVVEGAFMIFKKDWCEGRKPSGYERSGKHCSKEA